jgi:hypothetical protein
MSTAYKCNLTDQVMTEGAGIKRLLVDVGNLRFIVVPQCKNAKGQFEQGDLCPAAAEKIKAALLALKPKA